MVDIVAANASPGLSAFKAVRALRALRPLRILSKDENMKQVISSIGLILREIANIFLVLTLVWLVFAILGVQLFKGKLSSCGSGGAILDLCAGAGKDTPGYGDLSPIEALAVRERVCLELASEGCAWEGSSCEVSAVVEDLCASRHTAAECLQPVLALADLSYGLIDGEAGVSPTLGVDAHAWVQHLPWTVGAIFYTNLASENTIRSARGVHAGFHEAFPEADAPIVRFDIGNWVAPFSWG